ncbi:hypothetical protein DOM22_05115 [Bdellovibrio sp. ZAP7]|uniref:ABC transporter permease n=1 Tax=Bdellovibrio sp. ZAP7 TaxID=2231053 RepID=UPI0011580E57|nr:ABC transporter permease [Bdellovibrio sp. ZAP7]QDK44581.1 hypothetical protein DOM22_05115 [Bdellovibrio sp. ZAP7]
MKPLNQKLLRDMISLKFQILSMAVLMACGTAILIASWSAYNSLFRAKEDYYKSHNFADIFIDVIRAPYSTLDKIHNIAGIESLESRIIMDGVIDLKDQTEPALARIVSITPDMRINLLHLRSGRWPEANPVHEVLVHESFANAHHLKPGDIFSVTIKSQKRRVQVAGIAISPEYIYALSAFAPFPDDKHFGIIWMLENELQDISGLEGAFNNIVLTVDDPSSIPQIKTSLDHILNSFGTVGAYGRESVVSHIFIQDEIRQQKSMSYVVPAVFILVAIFILQTVLHRLIHMHRAQIATLKSLGYRSWPISLHYLKLVTVILILGLIPGSLIANAIGQWYAVLYRQFYRFPAIHFQISDWSLFIGFAATFLPGWLVAFISLRSIFKLQPAEAMRPALASDVFSHGTFTNIKPSRMSTRATMSLRNIISRPLRASFSVIGLSAATAILINGSFWSDVVNYVVDIQFREANREDIEVRFLHPRKGDVAAELRRLPGVQLVETARVVGINLILRNIKKSTVVIGTDNSRMRQILNSQKELTSWTDSTLLVSRYFEKEFKMRVGDEVTIELSDKSHGPFKAHIGAFADDLVGVSVYAHKSQLHRWLNEQPCSDTAYLKIDPSQSQKIYLALKQAPEVLAVQVKRLLFESFNKVLSKMIKTFTMMLFAFALTITIAVLFNLSRISLSERAWEFASLKIIGFHEREIFNILYSEMGLLLILAILPGFALGYFLSFLSTHLIHSETLSFPLIVNPETYALAALSLIASYILIARFLLRSIKKINMTEALKARE